MGFEILTLTPDEGDDSSNFDDEDNNDNSACNWMEDSECQENLFQIIPLMPEESVIDEDNHIQTHIKLFFEELGYLTEEPEPIDPTRDYDAEARQMLEERNRTRQKHVELSRVPSLAHSRSGVSSTSSSFHHTDFQHDVRSPLYMGHVGMDNYHLVPSHQPYHYQQHHHHHYPHHDKYPSTVASSCLNTDQHRNRHAVLHS